MTYREKFHMEHPDRDSVNTLGMGCPADYVHHTGCPEYSDGTVMSCKDCWNREIPEVDDATMEAVVEDLKEGTSKVIYAHVGPDFTGGYVKESSTIIQSAQPGKPDLELKVERKTMLGTKDMHIRTGTIPTSQIIGHPDHVGEPGKPGLPEWAECKIKSFDPNKFCDTCGWAKGLKCMCEEDCTDWDHWKEKEKDPIILSRDEKTELMAIIEKAMEPKILDSGNRRKFASGAVRDIQEGKGRCDLLPLDVVAEIFGCGEDSFVMWNIGEFQKTSETGHLVDAIDTFTQMYFHNSVPTMLLEVAKHFEEGAKKYGENNWQKGIPVHCYIDSAVRHYLKFLRGDKDEPHDRAFCWNIMCAIWTCKHKPELNEYDQKSEFSRKDLNTPQQGGYDPVAKAYDIVKNAVEKKSLFVDLDKVLGYLGEALE